MSAEDPFSMMDSARSGQALSDYLNSIGRIANPEQYRKETQEREDFNNKLLAGTGTVAAPMALAGIEGLKEDALKPGLRRLVGRTGIKMTEEGGVDVRGTLSDALKRLNPRARLETMRRIRAGDPGYTDEGMENPIQRVVRNPGDTPDLVDLPAEATRGLENPQDFRQGFFEGQRVLDQRIHDSGDLPTQPLSDEDILGYYERNAPDLEVNDARLAGHNLGQDLRNQHYKELDRQWRANQPEAVDDDPVQMRPQGEVDEFGDPTDVSLQEPRQLGGGFRPPAEAAAGPAPDEALMDARRMAPADFSFSRADMREAMGLPREQDNGPHGLGQEEGAVGPDEMPANGGGQPLAGAAEEEAGEVGRTIAPKAAARAGGDLGDEIGENAGKAATTALTTDAELGGPEDIFGDLVALGAGIGTLFGGLGDEKKAPTPVMRTPLNPASEFGL